MAYKKGSAIFNANEMDTYEWQGRGPRKGDIRLQGVFEDTLVFDTFEKGRSAVHVYLRSITTGTLFNVSLSNFLEIVSSYGMSTSGEVTGKFSFSKQGTALSLEAADEDKVDESYEKRQALVDSAEALSDKLVESNTWFQEFMKKHDQMNAEIVNLREE